MGSLTGKGADGLTRAILIVLMHVYCDLTFQEDIHIDVSSRSMAFERSNRGCTCSDSPQCNTVQSSPLPVQNTRVALTSSDCMLKDNNSAISSPSNGWIWRSRITVPTLLGAVAPVARARVAGQQWICWPLAPVPVDAECHEGYEETPREWYAPPAMTDKACRALGMGEHAATVQYCTYPATIQSQLRCKLQRL